MHIVERYGGLSGDKEAFAAALSKRTQKYFRINTLKADPTDIERRFRTQGLRFERVPWYADAFISEPRATRTLEHFAGWIYAQELSSMMPALVLGTRRHVLDACAAPGSKTTQLAAMMKNTGLIVANDSNRSRIRALNFNIEKCGALNTVVTNYDLLRLGNIKFDGVLLDVPCSSEGMCMNSPVKFSSANVRAHAELQKKLIVKAFDMLEDGGTMVYSTCTFAPEENEAVVEHLLKQRDARLDKIDIGTKLSNGVTEWNGQKFDQSLTRTARVWPHELNTEGFFMAKVIA